MEDRDLIPLFLLECPFKEDDTTEIPREACAAMNRLGRRNIWHGFFPLVLSRWVKWEHGTTELIEQFLVVCIEKLHQLCAERCRIVHECAMSKSRIEDHQSLLIYSRRMHVCIDADSLRVLK